MTYFICHTNAACSFEIRPSLSFRNNMPAKKFQTGLHARLYIINRARSEIPSLPHCSFVTLSLDALASFFSVFCNPSEWSCYHVGFSTMSRACPGCQSDVQFSGSLPRQFFSVEVSGYILISLDPTQQTTVIGIILPGPIPLMEMSTIYLEKKPRKKILLSLQMVWPP